MPGFISDAEMQDHLQTALHQPSGTTGEYWRKIAPKASTAAYWTIVSALVGRGFTKTQIDTWDRGAEFQYDLGTFWAFVKGGAGNPDDFDPELLKYLDRREELKDVVVTASGVELEPSASNFGSGAFSTDTDIFVWPTDADGDAIELGKVFQF